MLFHNLHHRLQTVRQYTYMLHSNYTSVLTASDVQIITIKIVYCRLVCNTSCMATQRALGKCDLCYTQLIAANFSFTVSQPYPDYLCDVAIASLPWQQHRAPPPIEPLCMHAFAVSCFRCSFLQAAM